MDCIFCKIISGEIPSNKVFENDDVFAFHDLSPKAPVHVLIIPKHHISSGVSDITTSNSFIVSKIFEAIPEIAKMLKLENGYRVVTNSGLDAGQTVAHLHFHILGGQALGEMA